MLALAGKIVVDLGVVLVKKRFFINRLGFNVTTALKVQTDSSSAMPAIESSSLALKALDIERRITPCLLNIESFDGGQSEACHRIQVGKERITSKVNNPDSHVRKRFVHYVQDRVRAVTIVGIVGQSNLKKSKQAIKQNAFT